MKARLVRTDNGVWYVQRKSWCFDDWVYVDNTCVTDEKQALEIFKAVVSGRRLKDATVILQANTRKQARAALQEIQP